MTLKFEQGQYKRAKEDARYITEIATRLETIKSLDEQNVVKPSSIHKDYEKRQLRDIKNAISNIYLVLDLHEVEGIVDEIFNSEFKNK